MSDSYKKYVNVFKNGEFGMPHDTLKIANKTLTIGLVKNPVQFVLELSFENEGLVAINVLGVEK